MDYIEVRFTCDESTGNILIAFLGNSGYEMFEETENGVKACIRNDKFDLDELNRLLQDIPALENIPFEKTLIPEQNWNSEWEKNFQPIRIAGKLFIRAPFHQSESCEIEIIIEPKMSFGTGHHSTTSLMAENILSLSLQRRKVLDMGCGSGILAILSSKTGAAEVVAIDNDTWAYQNCIENVGRNSVHNIHVILGGASDIPQNLFDVIFANINRNVLLADMQSYVNVLQDGSKLLLSGFLTEDKKAMIDKAESLGLRLEKESARNNWQFLQFSKRTSLEE